MIENNIAEILDDTPRNWGRWGDDDERGTANYLTSEEVLRGVQAIQSGRTFTLGIPIRNAAGDPVEASNIHHYMEMDKGHYESGKENSEFTAGMEAAEDVTHMPLHGTTHLDALGHVWYDDQLYNGFDANTTKGGLDRCDVRPIAEHGLVGHGVLLDIARHRGVDHLERNDRITLEDIKECADEQDVAINQRDVLLLRTGWLELFYDGDKEAFFGDSFREPGITYSEELVRWFYEQEIPVYGTDTLANEQTRSETTDSYFPVHAALLRDQGLIFIEILNLETLAGHCASTGQYEFLFVSSPLKFTGATGSPVNPIVVA